MALAFSVASFSWRGSFSPNSSLQVSMSVIAAAAFDSRVRPVTQLRLLINALHSFKLLAASPKFSTHVSIICLLLRLVTDLTTFTDARMAASAFSIAIAARPAASAPFVRGSDPATWLHRDGLMDFEQKSLKRLAWHVINNNASETNVIIKEDIFFLPIVCVNIARFNFYSLIWSVLFYSRAMGNCRRQKYVECYIQFMSIFIFLWVERKCWRKNNYVLGENF